MVLIIRWILLKWHLKKAAMQAFKDGFLKAEPVLLEPIETLSVTVPDSYTGDIMGDLNKRRGRVLGMQPMQGGWQTITADIPMSSLYGYCTVLRSLDRRTGQLLLSVCAL